MIISDGPYGLNCFYNDLSMPEKLPSWYEPHVRAWAEKSTPETTLWFWNSEIGWALVHPILAKHGWRYVACNVWDKGISHVAGNTNTKTLRRFPVSTEICAQYVREATVGDLPLKDWVRKEWERAGIPLTKTNEVGGVKNAATRKWFTKDHLWYFPPADAMERLAKYANENGKRAGRPYFSLDGKNPVTKDQWSKMRTKFRCPLGVTNVWRAPPVNGQERLKVKGKSVHLNQKPLSLMKLIIQASSEPNDVIWEPFGGLCTGAVAANQIGRRCLSAEKEPMFFRLAVERIKDEHETRGLTDDHWELPPNHLQVPVGPTLESGLT